MRCLACGAGMHLMHVVQDDTMPVPGYEHRTFMCSACGDIERRLVFARDIGENHTEPVSVHTRLRAMCDRMGWQVIEDGALKVPAGQA